MATVLSTSFVGTASTNLTSLAFTIGPAGWTAGIGTWTTDGNNAIPPGALNDNGHVTADAGNADGTLTMPVTMGSNGTVIFSYIGAVVRYTDTNNYYIARVKREGGNSILEILKKEAGTDTSLATQDLGVGIHDVTDTLTITLTGSTITLASSAGSNSVSVTTATFNQTATKVGLWGYTGFGNPSIPVEDFTFATAAATIPVIAAGATANTSTQIVGIVDCTGGAISAADASKATLSGESTLSASTTFSTISHSTGTTATERYTLALTSGGFVPGATMNLTLASGLLTNTNGASGAISEFDVTNDAPIEDITGDATFTVTGAHSYDVDFDLTGTMIDAYVGAGVGIPEASPAVVNDGDLVTFKVTIGGTDAAVADDWTFELLPPANLHLTSATTTTQGWAFDSVAGATAYQVRYREL